MKEPERNYDIAIQSAITAKQTAYETWKKYLIKSIQCDFVDDDGNMAYLANDFRKKSDEVFDVFVEACHKLDELREEQVSEWEKRRRG